jgi:hypothetical protein
MSNNIIMGYSANDFFYSQAGALMPSDDDCKNKLGDDSPLLTGGATWTTLCNDANFMDNSGNCIGRQLCINKDKVDFIEKNENSHMDAQKRNADMNIIYNRTVMDSVNLGIGILFVLFIIYRNRNIS